MKYNISDLLSNVVLEHIVVENDYLIKNVLEEIYPELDFSSYNIEIKDGKEVIDKFALYNEMLKHNQEFRDKIIENIDDYLKYGFISDYEFNYKVWSLSEAIENNLEDLVELDYLNNHKCFKYSRELMDLSSGYNKYGKHKSNQKRRIVEYKK